MMMPSNVAIVKIARGSLDAERADEADPLPDRGGQRRIIAAAACHQYRRVIERIAIRQQRHIGAVAAQGVDPAQHRCMQGAHAQRRFEPGDDLLVGGADVDRQHLKNSGAAVIDPRHHRHERRRHGIDGVQQFSRKESHRRRVGIGEQDSRRFDPHDCTRRLSEGAFRHRKRAGPRKRGRQLAVGAVGDDEDRAWQRHFTNLG